MCSFIRELRQPLPKASALAHYTEQAMLAGDAEHIAALIARRSYTPAEVALLQAAIDKAVIEQPEPIPTPEVSDSDFGAFEESMR